MYENHTCELRIFVVAESRYVFVEWYREWEWQKPCGLSPLTLNPPPSSIYDRSFPPGRDIPLSNNNRVCKIFIYDFQEVFVLTMYNVQDGFVMFTFTRFYTRKGAYKQFQNLKQVQWQRFFPSTKSEFVKSLIYLSDHITTSGVFKLWARNLIVHVRVI